MCSPLGATLQPGGVNFSVYSKNAQIVELLLFDSEEDSKPAWAITLDSRRHRTYYYWHVFVPDLMPGQVYAFRAIGPFKPELGLRFDGDRMLLDPYGLAVAIPKDYSRSSHDIATSMKSVVADPDSYDWEGDRPLQRPFMQTRSEE